MSVGMCTKLFKLFMSYLIRYSSTIECPDWFDFLLKELHLTPSEYTKYEEYHDLLHEKSRIEWDNFLRGKLLNDEESFRDDTSVAKLI